MLLKLCYITYSNPNSSSFHQQYNFPTIHALKHTTVVSLCKPGLKHLSHTTPLCGIALYDIFMHSTNHTHNRPFHLDSILCGNIYRLLDQKSKSLKGEWRPKVKEARRLKKQESSLVLTGWLETIGSRPLPLHLTLAFVESALEQTGHFLTFSPESF